MSDDPRERFRQLWGSGLQTAQSGRADAIVSLFDSGEAFAHAAGAIVTSALLTGQLTNGLYEFAKNQQDPSTIKLRELGARLEKRVGSGAINVVTLLNGLAPATQRICQILVAGDRQGTGFLVGPGLVLTNYHVVLSVLDDPERIECQFDCWDDAHFRAATNARVAVRAVVAKRPPPQYERSDVPASPRPIDYAVLELGRAPDGERGWYSLGDAVRPCLGSKVVVVGHPSVGPLSVSCSVATHLESSTGEPDRVFYDADTEPGSSGSLCLVVEGGALRPVALHRGADREGRKRNFGVPLVRIHADLAAQEVELNALGIAKREGVAAPDFDRLDAESLAKLLIALPGAPVTEAPSRGASASDARAQVAQMLRESWREEWNETAARVEKVSTDHPVIKVSQPEVEPPREVGRTVGCTASATLALLLPIALTFWPSPDATLIVEGGEPGDVVYVDGERMAWTSTAFSDLTVVPGAHRIEVLNAAGERVRFDHLVFEPGGRHTFALPVAPLPVTECVRVGGDDPRRQIVLVTAHGVDGLGDVCGVLDDVWAAEGGRAGVRVRLVDLQLRPEECGDACPDERERLLATLRGRGIADRLDGLVLVTAGSELAATEPERATASEPALWRLTLPTETGTSHRVTAIAHVIGRALGLSARAAQEGARHAWTPMVLGAAGPVRWSAADRVQLGWAEGEVVEASPIEQRLSSGVVAEIVVNGRRFLLEARPPPDEDGPGQGLLVWNPDGELEAWLGRGEEGVTVSPAPHRPEERDALALEGRELRFMRWSPEAAMYVFRARRPLCDEGALNRELAVLLSREIGRSGARASATAVAGPMRFRNVRVSVPGVAGIDADQIEAAIERRDLPRALRRVCDGESAHAVR